MENVENFVCVSLKLPLERDTGISATLKLFTSSCFLLHEALDTTRNARFFSRARAGEIEKKLSQHALWSNAACDSILEEKRRRVRVGCHRRDTKKHQVIAEKRKSFFMANFFCWMFFLQNERKNITHWYEYSCNNEGCAMLNCNFSKVFSNIFLVFFVRNRKQLCWQLESGRKFKKQLRLFEELSIFWYDSCRALLDSKKFYRVLGNY